MRRLGKNQLAWLRTIRNNRGRYYEGCGMTWNGPVATGRLCESLEKHGLLSCSEEKFSTISGFSTSRRDVWRITDKGREFLEGD